MNVGTVRLVPSETPFGNKKSVADLFSQFKWNKRIVRIAPDSGPSRYHLVLCFCIV